MNGFPAVWDTDWCGQHKMDETKIEPTVEQREVDDNRSFFRCEECGYLMPFNPNDVLEHDDFRCDACRHISRFELGNNRRAA